MSDLDTLLEFYICGCGILCCSVFGLVGNISTILLLKSRKMKMNQTFTNLIVWLAAIDSLFLVSCGLCSIHCTILLSGVCDSLLLPSLPLPIVQGENIPPHPALPPPPHQCHPLRQCLLCHCPGSGEVSTPQ